MNKAIRLRTNLGCETKFAGETIAEIDTDGMFSGYASLFDMVDLGQEVLTKGAFKASLDERGVANVRMLFQHNPDEPIGHWIEMYEDNKGLFVKGQLNLNVERGREVYALMQSGDIDGLSIGFKTVRARREQGGKIRRILEADLWEISVVTFPMLPQARVTNLKSGRLPTPREFERWLVRDAGFTRSQAKMVIAKGFASIQGARDAAQNTPYEQMKSAGDLARKIRQVTRHISNH